MGNIHSFLFKDDDGAVMVLFAVLGVPMLLLTAMSIELTRQSYIQTQLAYACDSGALAAAKYNVADIQTNGAKFFDANFYQDSQNSTDVTIQKTFSISSDSTTITCKAQGVVLTPLARIAKIFSLNLDALTVVIRSVYPSEVSIVLNVKGSTSGSGASGMSGSVNQFVNHMTQNKVQSNQLAISIIPYAATVNIGTNNASWLTNPADATNKDLFPTKVPWEGCISAAYTGLTMGNDDPPSVIKWPIYHADTTYQKFGVGVKGDNDYTQTATTVNVINKISQINVGPNRSCAQALFPIGIPDKNMTSYVNSLQGTNGGGDLGDIGLQWGWNNISPRWAGLWGASGFPKPYGETIKSIVLFSDGVSNWNDLAGYAPATGDPNAYGTDIARSTAGKLGATSPGFTGTCTNVNANVCINARIADLCKKIKAKGIQIFTINYGDSDPSTTATYAACATYPQWAFFPGESKGLASSFTTIGDVLVAQSVQIVK